MDISALVIVGSESRMDRWTDISGESFRSAKTEGRKGHRTSLFRAGLPMV